LLCFVGIFSFAFYKRKLKRTFISCFSPYFFLWFDLVGQGAEQPLVVGLD